MKTTMSRLPKTPRWKRSIQAAYNFLIENEERTLPLDLHKALKAHGYGLKKYSRIAEKSDASLSDVCESLGSKDGTAKYRDRRDKHVICYNDTIKPYGRIQWTLAHELGHIELGHLRDFPETGTKHSALEKSDYRILEAEANVFARELLAPSTVFIYIAETYNVREALCFYTIARSVFRLSKEASYYIATDLARNYSIYAKGARYLGGIPVAEMYEDYLREHHFKLLSDMYFFSSWLESYRYEFELLSYLGLGRHLERSHPGLRSISDVILAILSKLSPSSDC